MRRTALHFTKSLEKVLTIVANTVIAIEALGGLVSPFTDLSSVSPTPNCPLVALPHFVVLYHTVLYCALPCHTVLYYNIQVG